MGGLHTPGFSGRLCSMTQIPAPPKYELSLKAALVWAKLLPEDKAGRGKPSKLMQEQGDMLVSQHGYLIKGREAVKASTSTAAPAAVQRVKVQVGKQIPDLPDKMRDENLVPIMPNGKVWPMGIKGICNLCGNSLTYCPHPAPKVWLDFQTEGMVTFKGRRASVST